MLVLNVCRVVIDTSVNTYLVVNIVFNVFTRLLVARSPPYSVANRTDAIGQPRAQDHLLYSVPAYGKLGRYIPDAIKGVLTWYSGPRYEGAGT